MHGTMSSRYHVQPLIVLLITSILLVALPVPHPISVRAAAGAGYALSFGEASRSNDFVEVVGTFPLNNQPRTLSFWAKSSDGIYQGNADHIVNYGGASFNHAFGAMLRGGNRWWFYGHNDIDTGLVADTLWHYHAISYNGITVSYYIDGVLFGQSEINLDTFQSNLFVGIRPDKNFNNTFNGVIDEVRIWNRALSQAEARTDMRSKPPVSMEGLIGYWNFDEGSGQTISDATSNHYDGILGSSANTDDNDPTWVISDAPLTSELWVSGKVTNFDNSPTVGVTISDSTLVSTMTGLDGEYALVNLSEGAVIITPSKPGFVFSPTKRAVNIPPHQIGVSFENTTNQIILPAAGTIMVTRISSNTTCSGDFGLSLPKEAVIFQNYSAYTGEPYTITPALAAGTKLVFYAQQYCSGIRNLSTDPLHARITQVNANMWRIGWEDWTDGDFNDLVVEVRYTQSDKVFLPVLSKPIPDSDLAFLAPVSSGQTIEVIHGYNDPLPHETCVIGSSSDHCSNQKYGLDIKPSNQAQKEILAPLSGKVAWVSGDCLGIRTRDNHNLTICHFDSFSVEANSEISRGAVLGTRSTSWIHISIDDRYRNATKPAIPFSGIYAIEGTDFPRPVNESTDRDIYRNRMLTSTNIRK